MIIGHRGRTIEQLRQDLSRLTGGQRGLHPCP
jgi:ribosomal protein S3